MIDALQNTASAFAKQALTFCYYLKWEKLQGLLQDLEERLNFGAQVKHSLIVLY